MIKAGFYFIRRIQAVKDKSITFNFYLCKDAVATKLSIIHGIYFCVELLKKTINS